MAKLGKQFNSKDHGEMGEFKVLPLSGNPYRVKICKAKVKDNKARIAALKEGNDIPGKVYTFPLQVTEGEGKGSFVFVGLNLEHTSAQTVDIAYSHLNSMAKAAGVESFEDTDDLTGKEILIDVKIVAATSSYPEKNEVKQYHSLKGVAKPSKPSGKKEGKKSKPKVNFD